MFKPFQLIYKNRNMLKQTTFNDIKGKYAGSFMGLAWAVIYPILFLGCYAMMYIFVFNVRFDLFNTNEYVIMIFCGLIPYLGFQEAIASGTTSVVANANLLKNTLFPIELAPVKSVLAAQTTQFCGMILIVIATAIIGKLSVYTPIFLILWFFQVMFSVGLTWILASLNVVFRDIQNIIGIILLLLMMISPIAYPVDMVPANLQPFLKLNPLYYMISCYQDVFMNKRLPNQESLTVFIMMSLVIFVVGYIFFMRMKKVFTDNV